MIRGAATGSRSGVVGSNAPDQNPAIAEAAAGRSNKARTHRIMPRQLRSSRQVVCAQAIEPDLVVLPCGNQ